MLPSATEIVCLLGLRESLVGVSHECDFPPEVRRLPAVVHTSFDSARLSQHRIDEMVRSSLASGGGLYTVDEALLERLRPDLVIAQELCDVCAVPPASVLRAIERLDPAPRVISLHPHSLSDVIEDVRAIGNATGTSARAALEVAALEERLSRVRDAVEGASSRPRVAALEWLDPIMASGHWVPEMVRIAGGTDCLGREGEPSMCVEWKRVVDAAPEVLILMPCGFDVERTASDAALLARRPAWDGLPAVSAGEVYAVDGGAYFNRSGPRLVTGVEILGKILHPEVFGQAEPAEGYRRLAEEAA